MDTATALLITDNITTTLTTVFSKSTSSSNLANLSITIALGALCISLIAQGYALYVKEEKKKTLGQSFMLLASIFFALFAVWTIANTIELCLKLVLISILGIGAVIYGIMIWRNNRTDPSPETASLKNRDLAKELLIIGIDKTNFSNKNGDLIETAKQIAQAYKTIRDIINS